MEIGGEVWSLNEITQKYNHSNDRTNGIGFFFSFNSDVCAKAQFWGL